MRILITATAITLLLTGAVQAKDMKACSADWKAQKAASASGSQTRKQFMTTCLAAGAPGGAPAPVSTPMAHPVMTAAPAKAAMVAPAAAGAAPAGTTAKCKDGSFSMSKHHSGSCSRHGGVASFM